MKLTVNELQIFLAKILNKLHDDDVIEINLDIDLYNEIASDQMDVSINNPEIIVGSLIDDIQSLRENDEFSYVDFDRVASVLRSISQEMNPI